MNSPQEPRPRQRRDSVRRQARLDEETSVKLEALAKTFQRKYGQILRYVIQWGLAHTHRWTVEPPIPDRPHLVHVLVEPDLLQQVQDAAAADGASVAAWVRHAMRQVTRDDFPAHWCAGETDPRSHNSRTYGKRFMLRLDARTWAHLEELSTHFDTSSAKVIHYLVTQAKPKDFPESWQLVAEECRVRRAPLRNSQRSTLPGLRWP